MSTKYICPNHGERLRASETRYGLRWSCPVPECTVAQWNGSTSTPADAETRELRKRCHDMFDRCWKGKRNPRHKRKVLYEALSRLTGIPVAHCHFGFFFANECRLAISVMESNPDVFRAS